ncbi:glycosyltransferase [Sphingomonas sp. KR1UV-12]|uniref:Glycosyltransferase n=1 Tax=Sphingomonas aurea TaxID=3063994 RepID=A0ABT9EPB9_9SPHN|nr:glycosyltransferase [Sphingomonas sp. KR1UV-12]MDP1028814.1 glycosyltransferase [Sphingomonas sp. KR1UV-12]
MIPPGQDRASIAAIDAKEADTAVLLCVHRGANAAHFDEAIGSMKTQTYARMRLFVYCDGPLTDPLEDVLQRRLDLTDGRDIVLRGSRSCGLPTGLNTLIDHALATPAIAFMARMDADDISVPTRLAIQIGFLHDNPDVSAVGSWCIEFSHPGTADFYKRLPVKHQELATFMLYRSPFNHPTVVLRRHVFEQGFRYDPSLSQMQDYDLWSRLVIGGFRIANVPEFLLWFRMEAGFFARRAGLRRALSEVRMRIAYAKSAEMLRGVNYLRYTSLLLLRIAPVWVRKLLYRHLRSV